MSKRCKEEEGSSEVDEFFTNSRAPGDLSAVQAQLDEFVAVNAAAGRHLVLLTSGGTTVPLERNTVRFIDNFSTGSRGAQMCQSLLNSNSKVSVVYLHRVGSIMPFTSHLTTTTGGGTVDFGLLRHFTKDSVDDAHAHKQRALIQADAEACMLALKEHRLLAVPFVTVTEYLFKLRACAQTLNAASAQSKLMVVLAAAVSDFYVPDAAMEEHKIQSAGGEAGLRLDLTPVPKMLGALKRKWAPSAYCVSFKLETDDAILIRKARGAIAKYGVDLVVANELHSRYNKVVLVEATTDELVVVNKPSDGGGLIEGPLVRALLERGGMD